MKKLIQNLFCFALLVFANGAMASEYREDSLQPFSSENTFREFYLENNLKVLLISNPNRVKASTSMNVGVGSFSEPVEFPGIAHFLEHLLFLGTEKYPSIDEYKSHIDKYQGTHNAYTSGEHTNYHFSINHEGFVEALDRFAQFFIAPAFHAEFVDKERTAVDNEAANLKDNDGWKQLILNKRLMLASHPVSRYHPGDLITLAKIKREDVISFYDNNYSASDMSLVLDSNLSLDMMESLVKEKFSAIKDKGSKVQSFSSDLYAPGTLPLMLKVKTRKEQKSLALKFFMENKEKFWSSKPDHMISHLIGHEGKGSLLSSLKEEQLALGLSASFDHDSFASTFEVHIDLTEKGMANHAQVMERFFSYIELLRREGLPQYLFDEVKVMSENRYNFSYPNSNENMSQVIGLASKLRKHPALAVNQRSSLFYEYKPEIFQELLNQIIPENLLLMLTSDKIEGDLIEEDFKTSYKIHTLSKDELSSWWLPSERAELSLPEPNIFIPSALNGQVPSSDSTNVGKKIVDNEWGSFWLEEDKKLGHPKLFLKLLLLSPKVYESAKSWAITQVYAYSLMESLNEWNYQLSLAGISFSVSATPRGIELNINGYAEKAPLVLSELSTKLKNLLVEPDKFLLYVQKTKENYRNFHEEAPYQQVLYELGFHTMENRIHIHDIYDQSKDVDVLSTLTRSDIFDFSSAVYGEVAVEGVAYGRVEKNELTSKLNLFLQNLGSSPLPVSERPKETAKVYYTDNDKATEAQTVSNYFRFGPVINYLNSFVFVGQIFSSFNWFGQFFKSQWNCLFNSSQQSPKATRSPKLVELETKMNNNCFGQVVQMGERSPKSAAILKVAMSFVEGHFFNELRTKQELGYIVHAGIFNKKNILGMLFLVQSSSHVPLDISTAIDAWKLQVVEDMKKMPSEDLAAYKEAVKIDVLMESTSFGGFLATLDNHAYLLGENFSYEKEVAAAIDSLTLDDLVEEFQRMLVEKNAGQVSVAMTSVE